MKTERRAGKSLFPENGRVAVDRRAFLAGAVRYGLLGVLASLSILLGRRARGVDHGCGRNGFCSGCGLSRTCGLPAALSRRRAEGAS